VHYVQGDTDQVFVGEGTGGSRSATIGGSAVAAAPQRVSTKGKAVPAHLPNPQAPAPNFPHRRVSSPPTNPPPPTHAPPQNPPDAYHQGRSQRGHGAEQAT